MWHASNEKWQTTHDGRILYCHLLIHAEIYIYILDTYRRNDKNARRKTSSTKYLPLTLLQGFEKGYSRFACKRELEIEHNCNILTPLSYCRQRCVFLVLQGCSTGSPEATLLGDGFLYGILSASSPDLNSSGPKGSFGLMWLSLPHLVYNSVRSSTQLPATQLARRTQLSYIIIRRPLDLWNRMFNRHQAETTVMQFRGHSLPVRQSMRVSWDFLACPILLANFRLRDFLC